MLQRIFWKKQLGFLNYKFHEGRLGCSESGRTEAVLLLVAVPG